MGFGQAGLLGAVAASLVVEEHPPGHVPALPHKLGVNHAWETILKTKTVRSKSVQVGNINYTYNSVIELLFRRASVSSFSFKF